MPCISAGVQRCRRPFFDFGEVICCADLAHVYFVLM